MSVTLSAICEAFCRLATAELVCDILSHVAGLDGFFDSTQLIPYTQKDTTHFPRIQKELGVRYSAMLFFDDENGNIARVRIFPALLCP